MRLRPKMLCLLCLFLLAVPVLADPQPVSLAHWDPVEQHGLQEITFQLPFAVNNPYDASEVAVDGLFSAPSGRTLRAPAFYFEAAAPVAGRADTQSSWKIRFTPTEAGTYLFRVVARRGGGEEHKHGVGGFESVTSARPGFVKVGAANRRRFALSTGGGFFPIGANRCWGDLRAPDIYMSDVARLAGSGANCIRVWLAPWWLPIEKSPRNFDPAACARLDEIMSLAGTLGLKVVMCIEQFANFGARGGKAGRPESHPYHVANGGPCATSEAFFANAEARRLFQNRLRYIVARWGHSTALMSWELFNEVELVPFDRGTFRDHFMTVAAWHSEMGKWLRANDPFGHLICTSSDVRLQERLLAAGVVDFLQVHVYEHPDPARRLSAVTAWLTGRMSAPVLVGEFGPVAGENARDVVGRGIFVAALAGRGSGAVAGLQAVGDAEPCLERLAAAGRFFSDVPWQDGEFRPAEARIEPLPGERAELPRIGEVLALSGRRMTLLYAYSTAAVRDRWPAPVAFQFRLPDLARGEYAVEIWNPRDGVVLERAVRRATRLGLAIPLRQFPGEVALKVEPVHAAR